MDDEPIDDLDEAMTELAATYDEALRLPDDVAPKWPDDGKHV